MTDTKLHDLSDAIHHCIRVIRDNATFIQGELAGIGLAETLHTRTDALCRSLLGTCHDIGTELAGLETGPETHAPVGSEVETIERIMRWLREDMVRLCSLVTELEAAGREDAACELAYVLVAESAAHILQSYDQVKTTVASP